MTADDTGGGMQLKIRNLKMEQNILVVCSKERISLNEIPYILEWHYTVCLISMTICTQLKLTDITF